MRFDGPSEIMTRIPDFSTIEWNKAAAAQAAASYVAGTEEPWLTP
jgi:hypothetical protein